MLVFAFIVVFVVGALVGIFGITMLSKHFLNMTFDEMSRCGGMLITAGNNRESIVELTINDDEGYNHDMIVLSETK